MLHGVGHPSQQAAGELGHRRSDARGLTGRGVGAEDPPMHRFSRPAGRLAATLVLPSVVLAGCRSPERTGPDASTPHDPIILTEDFESPLDVRWSFTDASVWERVATGQGRALALTGPATYEPPVRSPLAIALWRETVPETFVLELRVRSTTTPRPHRDACLFFGYQDPTHFYYVHLGQEADPHSFGIFLVDGAPRRNIVESRTGGMAWSDGWHDVRLERDGATGTIEVFVDGDPLPALRAVDRTFGAGRIGVGSFDDTAWFDDIMIAMPGRPAG
jgi:hypothetical protein